MKMNPLLFLLSLFVFVPSSISAQKYIVDPIFADSVVAYEVRLKGGEWVNDFNSERVFRKNDTLKIHAQKSDNYYMFKMADSRKYYQIEADDLKFSLENEEENPFTRKHEIKHSAIGYFLASMTSVFVIAGLILLATLLCYVGRTDDNVFRMALFAAPVALLVASALEFATLLLYGMDSVWWCDSDRYGFWGALWRVIPFAVVVYAQYKCFNLYEYLLFRDECDDLGYPLKLTRKPAAWGIALFLPLLILAAIVIGSLGFSGTVPELIAIIPAFGVLLYGVWRTLKANQQTLGSRLGRTATCFIVIYLLGLLVTGFLLVVALFTIIVQIIIAAIVFFFFMSYSDHVVADAERQRREERRRRGY